MGTTEKYDSQANSPLFWLGVADNLAEAARVVQEAIMRDDTPLGRGPTHRLQGPLFMLRAFSLECRLKARYVLHTGPIARQGKITKNEVKTHDLLGLSRLVGLDVTPTERLVLQFLTAWSELGRYPVTVEQSKANRPPGASRDELWPEKYEAAFIALQSKLGQP